MTRLLLPLVLLFGCALGATYSADDPYDSGGVLSPEQAAYDVTFYDLDLSLSPGDSTLAGTVTVVARITSPTAWFVLDLDPLLAVEAVREGPGAGTPLAFRREGGKLWAAFPFMKQPGEVVEVAVTYGGRPRVAPNPPWSGGVTWARTPDGAPWIATTCQQEGPDVWWPAKDHVSDKADSIALHIRVPDPLVVATNGRHKGVEAHADGTSTHHWFVSTPISSYNIALNIAPYERLETTFESISGDAVPVHFWVLPGDRDNGEALLPEIVDHLRFHEEVAGPYPFRADKYGVAQTPHLGMEHQTIIAYGAGFDNGAMTGGRDWGFDALHHHELSHEWWGNLVTNADWSDMWLHEGFGSYMQPLYMERLQGTEGYHAYLDNMRRGLGNRRPVAPRDIRTAKQIYDGDIYSKGAWILHTLRHVVGDDVFFQALRRMAYPDPADEQVTDGSHVRFATTDDFLHLVEALSGEDLDWFFEVYVRQPKLPRVVQEQQGERLALRWEVPGGLDFPMPIDVQVGDEVRRVPMHGGRASLDVPVGTDIQIDPMNRVLREGNR